MSRSTSRIAWSKLPYNTSSKRLSRLGSCTPRSPGTNRSAPRSKAERTRPLSPAEVKNQFAHIDTHAHLDQATAALQTGYRLIEPQNAAAPLIQLRSSNHGETTIRVPFGYECNLTG